MFNGHFYHATIRKTVAVFGTLFNNLSVVRKTKSGDIADITKVPLSYGPKHKFLARIKELDSLDNMKLGVKLPRMSFEISDISYDSAAVNSIYNNMTVTDGTGATKNIRGYVPYTINMELSIMAKNQDDALQLLEQILPTFTPTYTIAVKYVEGASSIDVPITLMSTALSDEYEGDMNTQRTLIYTLGFSIKTKFFGQALDKKVILNTITGIFNGENNSHLATQSIIDYDALELQDDSIVLGNKEAIMNYFDFAYGELITMTVQATSSIEFTLNESLYGATSLSEGKLQSYEVEPNVDGGYIHTLVLYNNSGHFRIGEDLVRTGNNLIGSVVTYTIE